MEKGDKPHFACFEKKDLKFLFMFHVITSDCCNITVSN